MGVTVTTWIMSLLNALGLFYWIHANHPVFIFTCDFALVMLGYGVLRFYWLGREWARWLVMLTCLLCFWNVKGLGLTKVSPVVKPTIVIEAILAVYLLYFLNTRLVRQWFNQSDRESTPNHL